MKYVYICANCKYEYSDKSEYDNHLKSSTHFLSVRNMDNHASQNVDRQINKKLTENRVMINKFICTKCNKKYATRRGLSHHKLNNCGKLKIEIKN